MASSLASVGTEVVRSKRVQHDHINSSRKKRRIESRDAHVVSEHRDASPIEAGSNEADVQDSIVFVPSHPQGVKPLGNLYSASKPNLKTHAGSFALLPDELIVAVFEELDARQTLDLGATCKALYAFATHDELWKTHLTNSPLHSLHDGHQLEWRGTWRATYLGLHAENVSKIDCTGLYSDTLYRPFHCANVPLRQYTNPQQFRRRIPKVPNLLPEEFKKDWTDRPFILTEPVQKWNVYTEWDADELQQKYGERSFRCEAVDWPLRTYTQYMRDCNDESPLYLFDSKFVEKMGLKVEQGNANTDSNGVDYQPPTNFYPDLFTVLGDERPSHRWLIMGPARSGSSFHIDPNGTSAWNAVIRGRKYWIMSPEPPPGVYVTDDESEITSPSSIGEWLLGFHAEAREAGCFEGICEEGEVLHVPGGWYHLVLNLPNEDGSNLENIAITQNFVPEARLSRVLKFLREKPDQVSGFQFSDDNQDERVAGGSQAFNAYNLFVERLKQCHPDLLQAVLEQQEQEESKSASTQAVKWEEIVKEKDEGGASFSFGFGSDDEGEGNSNDLS